MEALNGHILPVLQHTCVKIDKGLKGINRGHRVALKVKAFSPLICAGTRYTDLIGPVLFQVDHTSKGQTEANNYAQYPVPFCLRESSSLCLTPEVELPDILNNSYVIL